MRNLTVFFLSCLCILWLDGALSLKCRTGNRQTDDRFQRIMVHCRHLHSGNGRDSGNSSSDEDESYEDNSDSDEKIFNKKFLIGQSTSETSNDTTTYRMRNNGNYNTTPRNQPSWSSRPYPYNKMNVSMNTRNPSMMANRTSTNMNGDRMGTNGKMPDEYEMHNSQEDQACVIQCFFDELDLVDRGGFPEEVAVTRIMTESIRDPDLRDFVRESVINCFSFINRDVNNEKCKFSQNLLSCLANKGRERCEDWDTQ